MNSQNNIDEQVVCASENCQQEGCIIADTDEEIRRYNDTVRNANGSRIVHDPNSSSVTVFNGI